MLGFRCGVFCALVEMLSLMFERGQVSLWHNGPEGCVAYSYGMFLMGYELQHSCPPTMAKWFYSTRLETRTKESTSIASVRVANLYAE